MMTHEQRARAAALYGVPLGAPKRPKIDRQKWREVMFKYAVKFGRLFN